MTYTSKGNLVPDTVITDLMLSEIERVRESNLVLDGFPRTVAQATALEERVNIACVFHLDVPLDDLTERLINRWIHAPSGRTYNYHFNPPLIKVCNT